MQALNDEHDRHGARRPARVRVRAPVLRRATLVAALIVASPAALAQIVTENAGVLSPETPTLREAFLYAESAHGRELEWEHRLTVGLDRSNELRLSLPTYARDLELAGGDASFAGIGDATLRWKHALWREDDVMRSGRWSLLAEVTGPTGDEDETADGQTIPADARLGGGDWTFGVGTAWTWIRDRQRFSAEGLLRHSTAHDGAQAGGQADLNLAYWYRLSPAAFTSTDVVEVRGVLELLSTYRLDSERAGSDADDGGAFVRALPGVQVFPSGPLLLEAGVELPIAQTLEDSVGDRRYALLFTLKFLF